MIIHSERLEGIDIRVVSCIEQLADKVMSRLNRDLIIVFGYRNLDEQTRLYNQGRTTDGKIVTNAKAGQSPHNFNCAVDCWIMNEHNTLIDWNNIAYKDLCREHATTVFNKIAWGGNFHTIIDYPHWEYKNWRMVRAMVEKIIPNIKDLN